MKNLFCKVSFVLSVLFIITGLSGCGGSLETKTERFSSKEIKTINITTEGNDVVIRSTENSEIAVTLKGYKEQMTLIKDDVLTVQIAPPKPGIHLKKPEVLYVDIPKNTDQIVQVESESGNVTIDHAQGTQFRVKTEVGDIQTTGMYGNVDVTAEVGKIETDFSIASEITANKSGLGQHFAGTIKGESADTSCSLNLYTNTGKVLLKK